MGTKIMGPKAYEEFRRWHNAEDGECTCRGERSQRRRNHPPIIIS
jgi:hypothetical protein